MFAQPGDGPHAVVVAVAVDAADHDEGGPVREGFGDEQVLGDAGAEVDHAVPVLLQEELEVDEVPGVGVGDAAGHEDGLVAGDGGGREGAHHRACPWS